MLLPLLLLLLPLVWQRAGALDVACLSPTDYHALLYLICSRSIVCSRIYHLDHFSPHWTSSSSSADNETPMTVDTAHEDYRRFVRQIARFELRQLQAGTLPEEWLPPALNTTALCVRSAQPVTVDAAFASQTLLALQTFGFFVKQEYNCADRNERLYMRSDGTMHCMCAPGHSCANEATYASILEALLILAIVAFVIWAVSQFVNTFTMTARLQAAIQKLDGGGKLS